MGSTPKIGCDVAKWNPIASYADMKADGISFAILKAVNKALRKDELFEQHWDGFTNAGIEILGTYHYTYAVSTVQAKACAEAWVKAVDGRNSLYFLDWENASLPTKDADATKNIICTYADVIGNAGGNLAIYTGMSLYNTYIRELNLTYEMWLARYYLEQREFIPADKPDMKYCPKCNNLIGWQYTSKGKVKGCQGYVDLDIANDEFLFGKRAFTGKIRDVKIKTVNC